MSLGDRTIVTPINLVDYYGAREALATHSQVFSILLVLLTVGVARQNRNNLCL